jgi:hypothetical protein
MSSDTWQVVQAFFILVAISGGLIAYGIALGRKEAATKATVLRAA